MISIDLVSIGPRESCQGLLLCVMVVSEVPYQTLKRSFNTAETLDVREMCAVRHTCGETALIVLNTLAPIHFSLDRRTQHR